MYETILPRLRSPRARALVPFTYVCFAAIGSAFLTLAPLAVAANPQYSATRAEYGGLTWLGTEPAGRVLPMPALGPYVPAYTPHPAYYGPSHQTFSSLTTPPTTTPLLTCTTAP